MPSTIKLTRLKLLRNNRRAGSKTACQVPGRKLFGLYVTGVLVYRGISKSRSCICQVHNMHHAQHFSWAKAQKTDFPTSAVRGVGKLKLGTTGELPYPKPALTFFGPNRQLPRSRIPRVEVERMEQLRRCVDESANSVTTKVPIAESQPRSRLHRRESLDDTRPAVSEPYFLYGKIALSTSSPLNRPARPTMAGTAAPRNGSC